jgi:uncharacterized protein YdaU (DUF1376 family)
MKKNKADIWMPFYISDYYRDTTHLTTVEHGAYLLLLLHAWTNKGEIPSDPKRMQAITRMKTKDWRSSRTALLKFFYVGENLEYRHKRVDAELGRAANLTETRSKAGRLGVETKRGNGPKPVSKTEANAPANAQQTTTPSQSHIQEEEKKDTSLRSVSQEKTKHASRISPDWKPSPAEIAYAEAQGLDAGRVAEKFLNYWLSAAKGAKADWSATWRNWCLTAADRGECLRAGVVGPARASGPSAKEIAMQRVLGGLDAASKTHNDVSKVLEGTAEEIV